jgi:hypothetical protein
MEESKNFRSLSLVFNLRNFLVLSWGSFVLEHSWQRARGENKTAEKLRKIRFLVIIKEAQQEVWVCVNVQCGDDVVFGSVSSTPRGNCFVITSL